MSFMATCARFQSGAEARERVRRSAASICFCSTIAIPAREIRADLVQLGKSKLAPNGLVLLHGIALERGDDPKAAWIEWSGVSAHGGISGWNWPRDHVAIGGPRAPGASPRAVVRREKKLWRIDCDSIGWRPPEWRRKSGPTKAVREQAALEARQVWLDSLLADRWKVQEIMDHQARAMDCADGAAETFRNSAPGSRESATRHGRPARAAQTLGGGIRSAQSEDRTTQDPDQGAKAILNAAKKACRKSGRCFQVLTGPKEAPAVRGEDPAGNPAPPAQSRNFSRRRKPAPSTRRSSSGCVRKVRSTGMPRGSASTNPMPPALEEQRRASQNLQREPKISLLVPVHNTPADFLEEMFASVADQTYDNWELCVVDGGSDRAGDARNVFDSWDRARPEDPRPAARRQSRDRGEHESRA